MISELVQAQRNFFETGQTLSYEFRDGQLQKLEAALKASEQKILDALASDLRKPALEAYVAEYWFSLEEVRFARKRLRRWMRPRRVKTSFTLQPAKSEVRSDPKGVVLILGPWNYPFQLIVAPLIAALSAGNCAVLKPSEFAPATSRVLTQIIRDTFSSQYVVCVEGASDVAEKLLQERFDHIFFTGGGAVGRIVMAAAAKHLTPVTLELGGKSPCIVDRSIDLEVAAKRVVWGKFFNAGQTCVAPDYLLVDKAIKDEFLSEMRRAAKKMFGENPRESRDFGRIVNERHFHRLNAFLNQGTTVMGGETKPDQLYISPTVLDDVSETSAVMREEIFGPILPVRSYEKLDEAIAFVKAREKPLALYLFSSDRKVQERVLNELSFGGGCVNDTLVHLNNPALPFGGVGESGMGAYHGEFGFQEFSHRKAVVRKPFKFDLWLRYPPYGNRLQWIRKWLR